MSLDPALAAVRLAVRREVIDPVPRLVVACSGGADSLALLTAALHEFPDRHVIGAVIDHGLQDGSATHTARVAAQMAGLGASETVSARVEVEASGQGPEAAAREARYVVLDQIAQRFDAPLVLLGHTRDDQAETALLGLTRGSGGRSIAGMRPRFAPGEVAGSPMFLRPLLGVSRVQTEAACRAQDIAFWTDPHNDDPRFTRSRVRHTVLPMLERELGPGVAETLARTAAQLRPDMEALDALAAAALEEEYDGEDGFDVRAVEALHYAVRTRMLRLAAIRAGCPPSELFAVHVDALEGQVWNREQLPKQIQLPGHVTAYRHGDRLRFGPTAVSS